MKTHFLKNHNIQEHLIVLSVREMSKGNRYVEFMLQLNDIFHVFDPTVIIINQIMYTFHRESIYIVENKTRETWYWGPKNF
jgi:hypothetical protein